MLERPHIVQAVGELDQDHPDVLGHRQDHLAEVLGLLFFGGLERDLRKLRHAVDEFRDVLAELLFNLLERRVRVLDGVVQKSGDDARNVEPELGQGLGDVGRMNHVRLAAERCCPDGPFRRTTAPLF